MVNNQWFMQNRQNGAGQLGNSLYDSNRNTQNPSQIGLYPSTLRPSSNMNVFTFDAAINLGKICIGEVWKPVTNIKIAVGEAWKNLI
jgi:hypothetical protein